MGAAEPSSQSCSELPTAGERPRSPGREPQHWGTPRPPEGSLWLAAGWKVIPRLPGDSPKGKDPTQRELGEQSGRGAAG